MKLDYSLVITCTIVLVEIHVHSGGEVICIFPQLSGVHKVASEKNHAMTN